MGNSNLFFESVFKRKLSDADTREYLTQITNEHPYFSPAQFFLLLQSEKGTTAYQQQAAKTSVLFNNPWWLQFQLQEKEQATGEISDTIIEDDKQVVLTENDADLAPETLEWNETPDNIETTGIDHPTEGIIAESDVTSTNKMGLSSQTHEAVIDNIAEEELEPSIQESIFLDPVNATEEFIPENTLETATVEDIVSKQGNNVEEINAEKEMKTAFNGPNILSQQEKEINSVSSESAVSNVPEDEGEIREALPSGHFNNESTPLVNETEADDEPVSDQEIEPLNFKLNIDTANTTEDTITFEPLHTSDYFASLGIKLSGEIPASDKLGKQLKSFTEWLKTMKKIHGDHLPQQSAQADLSIQKLAEQSNKNDTIVTEAMAEVLLQQGKADKAIEVYKKLSLLNPSKRAFFAAKIDQLKEN